MLAVVTVLIPIYFEELGIPLAINALIVGISALPWAIKFIWGGVVDYFIGFGRKRFIIVGGILGAVGFLLLTVVDPRIALIPFALLMFIGHVGIAFLDVSADAWAIEITHINERGKINGAMFMGQFAGLGFGSIVLAMIAELSDYNTAFIIAAVIIILTIIYPLFVKYIIISREHQKVGSLLVKEFKKKTTQLVAIFAPLVSISYGFLQFAIPLYSKIILNLDIAQIGAIVGINSVMIAIGSLIGGGMTDKFGRKTSTYIFISMSIIFSALLIIATSWQLIIFFYSAFGFMVGGYTTTTSTISMDITNPKIGATQYSLLMSLYNSGEIAGDTVAGTLIALLGFSRVFLYSAWVFGPALLVFYFIRPKKNELYGVIHE